MCIDVGWSGEAIGFVLLPSNELMGLLCPSTDHPLLLPCQLI
jgi:hypothetical protein